MPGSHVTDTTTSPTNMNVNSFGDPEIRRSGSPTKLREGHNNFKDKISTINQATGDTFFTGPNTHLISFGSNPGLYNSHNNNDDDKKQKTYVSKKEFNIVNPASLPKNFESTLFIINNKLNALKDDLSRLINEPSNPENITDIYSKMVGFNSIAGVLRTIIDDIEILKETVAKSLPASDPNNAQHRAPFQTNLSTPKKGDFTQQSPHNNNSFTGNQRYSSQRPSLSSPLTTNRNKVKETPSSPAARVNPSRATRVQSEPLTFKGNTNQFLDTNITSLINGINLLQDTLNIHLAQWTEAYKDFFHKVYMHLENTIEANKAEYDGSLKTLLERNQALMIQQRLDKIQIEALVSDNKRFLQQINAPQAETPEGKEDTRL